MAAAAAADAAALSSARSSKKKKTLLFREHTFICCVMSAECFCSYVSRLLYDDNLIKLAL